jgi:hypothetical protein
MENRIFSFDSAKAIKAVGFGYYNAIHYLAPHSLSGKNLCSHASAECISHCLGWHSGQAAMVKNEADINSVRQSRLDKAKRFMSDRKAYLRDIAVSIANGHAKAQKRGLKLCVRLNGSSDIAFEGIAIEIDGTLASKLSKAFGRPFAIGRYANMMTLFSELQFVDYTKNHSRLNRKLPANYSLTLSRHEKNEAQSIAALAAGHNVAVIFDELPSHWHGFTVINGDEHDLRHLDARGVVVGLKAKGNKLKKSDSAFVVRIAQNQTAKRKVAA